MKEFENVKCAKFTFEFGKNNAIILQSMLPETKRVISRTKVEIKEENKKLVMKIIANDTTSLRAAINSYLRWINCSLEVCNLVK